MDTRLLVAILVSLFALPPQPVDEGQWLPSQVRAMDWEKLRARGMALSKDEFWHPEKGGVLTAAVQLSGCSASFVSPDGLVVTNHHCAFDAVQKVSTVERNYVRDGFVATTREAEILAPGVEVNIVRKIEDVTAQVHEAMKGATDDADRAARVTATLNKLVSEGEREPDTTCTVASFLDGKEFNLYYRTRLRDVRLVYVPPRSIGEYGGEDDNWEWPRHTGDFTFLRAYAAPDGSPRPYSKENVPYRPQHYLKVSTQGVKDGDLAIVMGYPGRTERYLTSVAVRSRQDVLYPRRHDVFTRVIDILTKAGKTDPKLELTLSSTIKSMANVQKNALGMVKGLERNGVVARKEREETEFRAWVSADAERAKRFGSVLDEMLELESDMRATDHKDLVLGAFLSRTGPQFVGSFVQSFQVSTEALTRSDSRASADVKRRLSSLLGQGMLDLLEPVQKPVLAVLFDEVKRLPRGQEIEGMPAIEGTGAEAVQALFSKSKLLNAEVRKQIVDSAGLYLLDSKDPLAVLARGLAKESAELQRRQQVSRGRRLVVGRRWIEAQEAWRGSAFYPDANGTMRVAFGTIKGYAKADGLLATSQTTVGGLLSKNTGNEPFDSPTALLTAAKSRKSSRFVDAGLGDVPVCFLMDGDTTGGNSGSCIVNGKGELIGLNFDRVFENVVGDFGWSAERSRNIGVDIRYILWCLESVIPAPALLKEIGA